LARGTIVLVTAIARSETRKIEAKHVIWLIPFLYGSVAVIDDRVQSRLEFTEAVGIA
jgi:hypothetical protein